jgi:excisionase family DNA binding protein
MAGAFGHNEVQVQETRSTVRWLTEQTATMARGDVDHDHEEVVDEDREEEAPELPFEIIVGVVSMILQDWWNQHSDALLEAERVAEWLHFRIEQPVHRLTMTVEEAGQALGMSRATVYEAVGRGEILCIRIGRRILIQWMAPERAKQPSHNQQ